MNEAASPKNWIDGLKKHGTVKTYLAGEVIYFQGDQVRKVGVVLTGQAYALIYSERGQETWVGQFSEGDFFGHGALLAGRVMDVELIADKETIILFIQAAHFETLLLSHSTLRTHIIKDLAERLYKATNRAVEAVTLSARGRVCAEFLRMSKPIGIEPDKLIIRPVPPFTDIALRISTTRETVSRTVSDLVKDGILVREMGAIVIAKPANFKRRIE
jgi:CRP-like cAMP-binding protein